MRLSVQGIKSLVGHFACFCQEFGFYEVKKIFHYFFQIYIDAPQGVPGVSKNSQNMLQIKVLSSWPFGSQNIKNNVFGIELFSIHLPLCHSAETRC